MENKKYVLVRTCLSGVYAGYLESYDGTEVILKKARPLWYWSGATSLKQIAVKGVQYPLECKFPIEMDSVALTEAIEILDTTPEAESSIIHAPVWEM